MSVNSMTGYGQSEYTGTAVTVRVEVRAVNHRFADLSVRLPREYMILEEDIRRRIQHRVSRGRVDAVVTIVVRNRADNRIRVNWPLFDALWAAQEEARNRVGDQSSSVPDVRPWLAYPDVIQVEAVADEIDRVREDVLHAVDAALDVLVGMRAREGHRLTEDMKLKLAAVEDLVGDITACAEATRTTERDKMVRKLADIEFPMDSTRLIPELIEWLERSSIEEELVRLRSHVKEFQQALDNGSPVGRRLDFIVQEMHRETNTIGSKATDVVVSKAVVEVKVLIEQIREQVQNME